MTHATSILDKIEKKNEPKREKRSRRKAYLVKKVVLPVRRRKPCIYHIVQQQRLRQAHVGHWLDMVYLPPPPPPGGIL